MKIASNVPASVVMPIDAFFKSDDMSFIPLNAFLLDIFGFNTYTALKGGG
jgi:hypothetical protein